MLYNFGAFSVLSRIFQSKVKDGPEKRCRESDATLKTNITIPACVLLTQDLIKIMGEFGETLQNL